MKTQLLEDFDESGSAPSGRQPGGAGQPAGPDPTPDPTPEGVATTPRPAVWQHPQREAAPAPAPAPAPAASTAPATPRPAHADTARTEPLRVRPHGFAPQPYAPQPAALPGNDPDWLAAHLARDAALNERSEWSGRWTRRLAAWGAAGVLLALVAGGGAWLYQQSQVDGALVVVANTNPAPAGAAARRGFGHAAPGLPAVAPVSSTAAVPAPAVSEAPAMADVQKNAGVGATGGLSGGSTGASTGASTDAAPVESRGGSARHAPASTASVSDAPPEIAPPTPKRQRSHARKHPKPVASAAADDADSEAAYRQRREETLMQCRAHGYDDRQCFQRGCEMTKFGFACKG